MKKRKIETYTEIIILVILIIICIITSFKTGQRYYDLKNTQFQDANSKVETDIANWYFEVKVVY